MIYPRAREKARHLSDGELDDLLAEAEKGTEEYRGLFDERIIRRNRQDHRRPKAETVKADLMGVMRELSRWRRRIGVVEGTSLYCFYLEGRRRELLRELKRRKR